MTKEEIYQAMINNVDYTSGVDPCWRWRGPYNGDKSQFNFRVGGLKVRIYPHRFLFQYLRKIFLNGRNITKIESCKTDFCVKPYHYMLKEKSEKKRQYFERSRLNKLERAKEIISRAASGERQSDLARFYNIDEAAVSMIVTGKRYKTLDRPKLSK